MFTHYYYTGYDNLNAINSFKKTTSFLYYLYEYKKLHLL